MNDTILPGEYNLADAVVGNHNEPVRSTWQNLIRKPLTWIIVGAAIIGAAAAIMVLGRPGAVTPSSILKSDGYSTAMTFSHDQLVQAMNSDGGSGSSGLNPGDYFTTAAAGVNGGNEEIVLGMTTEGKGLDPMLVTVLSGQSGVQARTVDNGSYIVVSGSAGSLGGLASGGTTVQ